MSNHPTVLPWHKAAATDIHETPLPTMSQYVNIIKCMEARIDRLSSIIARHDPHQPDVEAAKAKKMAELFIDAKGWPEQHAETLRLLEAICGTIEAHEIESLDCDRSGNDYCDCLRKIIAKARAHLAAMQKSAKQERSQ